MDPRRRARSTSRPPPTGPDGDRVTSRRIAVVAVVAIVVIVVAGAGWAVTGGLRAATSASALGTPHFVDVTASSGVDADLRRAVPVRGRRGRGRPRLRRRRPAGPVSRRRRRPGRPGTQRHAGRWRPAFHGRPRSGDRPDRRDRRLSARHRRRRAGRSRGPADGRQRAAARARWLPVRARQRGARVRRREPDHDGVQRDMGGHGDAADARLRQLRRGPRQPGPRPPVRRQRARPAGRRRRALRRADAR